MHNSYGVHVNSENEVQKETLRVIKITFVCIKIAHTQKLKNRRIT